MAISLDIAPSLHAASPPVPPAPSTAAWRRHHAGVPCLLQDVSRHAPSTESVPVRSRSGCRRGTRTSMMRASMRDAGIAGCYGPHHLLRSGDTELPDIVRRRRRCSGHGPELLEPFSNRAGLASLGNVATDGRNEGARRMPFVSSRRQRRAETPPAEAPCSQSPRSSAVSPWSATARRIQRIALAASAFLTASACRSSFRILAMSRA